jgi:regulator of sigma E protease
MLQGKSVLVNEIDVITEGMPAYHAGLMKGDIITHINNVPTESGDDVIESITTSNGQLIVMRVLRNNENLTFSLTPEFKDGRYFIGIVPKLGSEGISIFEGVSGASKNIIEIIRGPFVLLSYLFSEEPMPEGANVMGPIGLGDFVTEAYNETIKYGILDMIFTMLLITAVISAALGVMNLLPIPALDGARIIFLLIEAVRRKKVPPEKEALVHFVGLVVLLLIAVVIAYQDIVRIIDVDNISG